MSSSASKLQRADASEPASFCYAEARLPGGASAEDSRQRTQAATTSGGLRKGPRHRPAGAPSLHSMPRSVKAGNKSGGRLTSSPANAPATTAVSKAKWFVLRSRLPAKFCIAKCNSTRTLWLVLYMSRSRNWMRAATLTFMSIRREATEWRHYFACQAEGAPAPEVHEDPAIAQGECRSKLRLARPKSAWNYNSRKSKPDCSTCSLSVRRYAASSSTAPSATAAGTR